MKYTNNVPVVKKKSAKEKNVYDLAISVHISMYRDTAGGILTKKVVSFFKN